MKTEKIPLSPFKVKARCECGGEFVSTGVIMMVYPAFYEHKCDKCEKIERFTKEYPHIAYEENTEEEVQQDV